MSSTETFLLYVHAETDRAYKVSENDDEDEAFWLPKSQVETDHDDVCKDPLSKMYYFEIPMWLAREKGLIQ